MARKSIGLVGILVIAAFAFAAGYLPEHRKHMDAAGDLQVADQQLTEAMGRLRIVHLENLLLQALDRAAQKDYEGAQNRVTQFFVEVRATLARPDMGKFKPELQAILERCDGIQKALEKEDPGARDTLSEVMQQLARIVSPPATSEPPAILRATPAT